MTIIFLPRSWRESWRERQEVCVIFTHTENRVLFLINRFGFEEEEVVAKKKEKEPEISSGKMINKYYLLNFNDNTAVIWIDLLYIWKETKKELV